MNRIAYHFTVPASDRTDGPPPGEYLVATYEGDVTELIYRGPEMSTWGPPVIGKRVP